MRNDLRPARRKEALERQAEREVRGDMGQVAKLEREGHGHCKEAERLRARIAKGKKS